MSEKQPSTTIYDTFRPAEDRRARRLPGLLASAFRLLWTSAPTEFLVVGALQLLTGAAAAVLLLLVNQLVATIQISGSDFVPVLGWLVGLGVITLVTTYAASVQFEFNRLMSELVGRSVAIRVFAVAAAADLASFERPDFHDRLERAWTSGSMRSIQVSQAVVGLLGSGAGSLGILAVLLAIVPVMIPIFLIGAVPILLITSRSSRLFYDFAFGMTPLERQRMYLTRVLTHRQHAHEIIAFAVALFDRRMSDLRKLVRRRLLLALLASAGTATLLILPVGVVAWLLVIGQMQVAQAVTAATGLIFLGPSLRQLITSATELYEVSLYLEDYEAFLKMREMLAGRDAGAPAPSNFERLRVEHVGFDYPESARPALEDVSLDIGRGEVIALVGENGSGKTTLAKVLCGLYRPSNGRVLWDGQDVTGFDAASMRQSVAVLFQDFCQYFLSLRENIAVGRHELAEDEGSILAAAQRAGAAGFVADLPAGYETLLGPEFEGGHNLSIGQWQRVALARAFIRDAGFVILDEPTASLDARAEHDLFESIRDLFKGRTVLLISHRFSTVRSADRIYVLRKGHVEESGTHAELMRNQGLYAELFAMQAAAYSESATHS
jgi:ATP-binding cassette subfamily B protein